MGEIERAPIVMRHTTRNADTASAISGQEVCLIWLYLAANPDTVAANITPLTHFLQFGIFEGRLAVPADTIV
jgi:hypothetical protein